MVPQVEEKDRRIHMLEFKVQQLMRDTLTISEEQARLQKENNSLLRALSKLTTDRNAQRKSKADETWSVTNLFQFLSLYFHVITKKTKIYRFLFVNCSCALIKFLFAFRIFRNEPETKRFFRVYKKPIVEKIILVLEVFHKL